MLFCLTGDSSVRVETFGFADGTFKADCS